MNGKQQPEVTPIPSEKEAAFRTWVRAYKVNDLDASDSHYDYRGAFLAGVRPDAKGHWPDMFKQHGHPTFSVESQYSNGPNDGGHWEGDKFVPQSNDTAATLTPTYDAYTPMELVKIINNGAQVQRGHPQYARVREIMAQAHTELGRQMAEENAADYTASHPINPAVAGIENFGQGASLGLLGQNSPIPFLQGLIDPQYLQEARSQQPLASGIGEVGGAGTVMGAMSPLVSGLGPLLGGAVLGGGVGATQGAAEAAPGHRATGAVIGGGLGAAGGAAGGAAAKVLGTVGRNVGKVGAKLLGKTAPGTLSDEAAATAQTVGRQASGGVTLEMPAEKLSPIAGTEGRGFEVTGERATPPVPSTPTIAEIQERLGQARARFEAHGYSATPGELPQPSGGATLTPKGAAPAADPTEPFPTARRITGTLQQAEEKAGRPLLPEEKEKVLAANAAKLNVQQFGKERAVLADVERRMGRPLTQEEKRQVLKKLLGDYTKTQPWSPATPE